MLQVQNVGPSLTIPAKENSQFLRCLYIALPVSSLSDLNFQFISILKYGKTSEVQYPLLLLKNSNPQQTVTALNVLTLARYVIKFLKRIYI